MRAASYKIVHTTCHTGWGGLEKRVFNESVWMAKQGHQVILIAPDGTPLYKRAKTQGFRVYPVSFKTLDTFHNYRRLKEILHSERPHILNTHGNADAKIALKAAQKTEVPLRILSRHISAHVRNSWYNRCLYKKWSHYVFTTADYTTAHLKKVFNLSEMNVFSMPSGIMVPEQMPDRQAARQMMAETLNLPSESRFIGFTGRVSSDKGVDILLEAFSRICPEIPHHLIIAGDGPQDYVDRLKSSVEKAGVEDRVHFLGFKEDVWPLYRAFY